MVAFGINGNVVEPCVADARCKVAGGEGFHKRNALSRRYLNARELTVRATADLREPGFDEQVFGGFDGGQLFGGDGVAVGHAACKAGVGRLVPGGKAQRVRKLAHVGFGKAGFQQGAFNGQLGKRLKAGAIVAKVASVRAFGNVKKPQVGSFLQDAAEQVLHT